MTDWLTFTVYGLACYRLALLFSADVGPWGMFSKLRSFLKREAKYNKPLRESKVHLGVSCIKCESVWMAVPIAAYVFTNSFYPPWLVAVCEAFFLMLALSAIAILVSRALPPK